MKTKNKSATFKERTLTVRIAIRGLDVPIHLRKGSACPYIDGAGSSRCDTANGNDPVGVQRDEGAFVASQCACHFFPANGLFAA